MPVNGTLRVTGTTIPQIQSFGMTAGGDFQLGGIGPVDSTYKVLATTNIAEPLSNWTQVDSGTFSGGTFTFTDPNTTNYPRRFYQVVMP
jgi:hypothetical protein